MGFQSNPTLHSSKHRAVIPCNATQTQVKDQLSQGADTTL